MTAGNTELENNAEPPIAVRVENAMVRLGGQDILRGVSAAFRSGELSAILGPNGAGKSTLVRALLGGVPLAGGTVEILGRKLKDYDSRELARTVAVVPQDTHFDFSFSVEECVLMGRYPHLRPLERERRVDHEAVRAALEQLDLTPLRARDVTTLSGGERQLVLLARAVATGARTILADEPFAQLDIGHQLEALDLLRALVADGYCVVLVLHDINLAVKYADRILLVHEGRLVKEGSPAEIAAASEIEDVFAIRVERRGGILDFTRQAPRKTDAGDS